MENRWARRTVKGGLEANPMPRARHQQNETIDFDRVMMDSWRPRHVTAQSEIPEHVPGPGSSPPPPSDPERATAAYWLVDRRRAIRGLAFLAGALFLVGAAGFSAGLSLGRHQGSLVADADSPAPSAPTLHIGSFEVAPLTANAAALPPRPLAAPPEASASVAAVEPGPPPILPIPPSDRIEGARSRPPAATERRRRSRHRAASSERHRSRPAPNEPALPPPVDADSLAAPTEPAPRITAASLAKWDEVEPPSQLEQTAEHEADVAVEAEVEPGSEVAPVLDPSPIPTL